MGIKDIIKKSFLEGYATSDIQLGTVFICMLFTAAIAAYIFLVYKSLNKNSFYNKNFNISLMGMAVVTAAVILTIQSNIVVSLGMVGALSIVRFRTAIKEPMDIAFLFWAIAAGIVLAAGMIPLAVFGSVIIGIVMLLFVNRKAGQNPYIAVISCRDSAAEQAAKEFLAQHVEKAVIKSKTAQAGQIELNYEIRLRKENTDFITQLSEMDGVHSAVLVSYNGDYLG